jgi:peptide/nickel transport system substrate-binding protein
MPVDIFFPLEENMKRFFSLAALFALGFSLVFAGGGQQGGGGQGADSSQPDRQAGTMGYSITVENADINDTTSDIDISKLVLKSAPGLQGNVKDRLPVVPKLVNEIPADLLKYEIGKYGGTIRYATSTADWDAHVFIACTEPLLNTPAILGKEVTGNVLRGYTVSPNQQEFTFYLREGLKWSDGVPVTMEDIRFTIEDVMFNETLTPSISNRYRSGGEKDGTPMKFTIVDDWTFKLTFDKPYGGFIVNIAIVGWIGYTDLLKPAHYLKPYHIKYASAAEKAKWPALIREHGFAENDPNAWANLFNKIDIANWDLCQKVGIGFPNLYPWILTSANDTVYTYTRNPYYFKIDSAGNQLPYADKLESYRVENIEMLELKMLAGEVDYNLNEVGINNLSLYKENEKSGFTVYLVPAHVTYADVALNLSWADGDAEYLSIVQNKKFRQALNKAVDREELIDTVYYGFAKVSNQTADPTNTPDKAGAERLLQEIGMRKGSDGYYRTPSGKIFEILFELAPDSPLHMPYTELVAEMWKNIGIKTTIKRVENSYRDNLQSANKLQARTFWTHTPLWYMQDWGMGVWGRAWEIYFTNTTKVSITNADGTVTEQTVKSETPPPEVQEFQRMIQSLMAGSLTEANATYAKIKANLKENLWYFVFLEETTQPVLVNSRLRNVPTGAMGIATGFAAEILWYGN